MMGGHRQQCNQCGFERNAYNSCGDRHCPKCRTLAKERWLDARRRELLPTGYFHLHCLVPAGAWSFDRSRWAPSRKRYLFRVKSLAKQFRKTYLNHLKELYEKGGLRFHGQIASMADRESFARLMAALRNKQWIVYAKAPFAGPAQVLDYLGRYTHRVAIANHRLLSMDDGKVIFSYKDRSQDNRTRRMTLAAEEFIRRFLLHVLPPRFVKIRYFGFLFHRDKRRNIALLRSLMEAPTDRIDEPIAEDAQQIMLRLTGIDIDSCPYCGQGQMVVLFNIPKGSRIRDPP